MRNTVVLLFLVPLVLSGCGTLISRRGTDIHWYGHFTKGDAERFRTKLSPDTRRLIITSPGGVAEEFIEVAHIVQERSIAVQVKDYCASACAFLFLAAKERVLPDDSFLAFHASPQDIALSNLTSEQLAQFLEDDDATKAYRKAMHEQLQKFHDDLRQIFERAGVQRDLYEKLVLLEGVIPRSAKIKSGSVVRDSEQAKEITHISAVLELARCGRQAWVPDQEGLARIGVGLAQAYDRPPKDRIAKRLHLKEEAILFDRIDDLTGVTCKTPEPSIPTHAGQDASASAR